LAPQLESGVSVAGSPAPLAPPSPNHAGRSSGGRYNILGRRRAQPGQASVWSALLWLAPSLVLIVGVVIFPAYELIRASLSDYSITGLRKGSAGLDNYRSVLDLPALGVVLRNTGIWVVAVVVLTILISLALAQFMAKEFVGRRLMRWSIIIPWAASLVITARLFTLILDYNHGILNRLLIWLHLIGQPVDFLGDDRYTMASMVGVGVFVSIPFTAYVLLAGLNAIPQDIYEAARVDGARAWQIYWNITLPLLRPAILVASVLNLIYVFNSFPVVYTLNDRNPGYTHDTSITFSYKLAFKSAEHSVGMSAAAGIFNVILILLVVLVYLRLIKWREVTQS
jgi:multiple sugar transport system permease protein